jgi:hypothetical protein
MKDQKMKKLPYEFDLLWDIKTFEQLHDILNGGMHCTHVDESDLVELMQEMDIPLPEDYKPSFKLDFPSEIWIDNNGGYLTYKPEEEDLYQRMTRPRSLLH